MKECKPNETETKLGKTVSRKMSEKKYIILEQILGMESGQQPTDQRTVLQDKLAEGRCICALPAGQKEAVSPVGACKPTG